MNDDMNEYEFTVKLTTYAQFTNETLESFSKEIKEMFMDSGFMCVEVQKKQTKKVIEKVIEND